MYLINDLGNDVVFAVLVEKTHEKLDFREARTLIERIERELRETLSSHPEQREAKAREH